MTNGRAADVIVIGGGVAGLAAAGALGRRGFSVTLLEARDRLGGRVCTLHPAGWGLPVEVGAEFVHGGNPALWRLLRRHRLGTKPVPFKHWQRRERLEEIGDLAERLERVTDKIEPRKMRTWSFAEFMRRKGKVLDDADRELALTFVEGFEAAPSTRMSAAALAGETFEDDEQFRLPGGYDRLIDALVRELPRGRVTVLRRAVVNRIEWRRRAVRVRAGGEWHAARAALVTLPLGVWQARAPARGAVEFVPPLKAKQSVVRRMGLGHVIRLVLRFDARRWRALLPEELRRRASRGFGFLHSRLGGVPVWWSLSGAPVITGWAGGPAAEALAGRSRCGIREQALGSLGRIFGRSKRELRDAVIAWETHNWSRDPFSRGAYSFIAAGADEAAKTLRAPVRDTLFFAGEATADGEEVGTVHGALASGLRAAEEIRAALKEGER